MKRIIALLIISVLTSGCADLLFPFYNPYAKSTIKDPYQKLTECNKNFWKVYDSDLHLWIGKTTKELRDALPKGYDSTSDTDGNEIIEYCLYEFFPVLGCSNKKLFFYVKNNKIYRVVRQ